MVVFAASIGAVGFVTLATMAGLMDPAAAFGHSSSHSIVDNTETSNDEAISSSSFAQLAVQKVLSDAAPIFGDYQNTQTSTSNWMKAYDDDTLLVNMNIPGTHDTSTWNYSVTEQQRIAHVTNLVDPDLDINSTFFRCQAQPIIDMLDSGIRAFDLRYAFDVTNSTLVFWHGKALQSETASLEDVLYAYFHWLDQHPSEVVFLSAMFEGNTEVHNVIDEQVQQAIYSVLTTPAAKHYILQHNGRLGTLGRARGKIILLRRFDLDMLPSSYEDSIAGYHFSPYNWTVNGANITLQYSDVGTAYIEDYYQPVLGNGSTLAENIQYKVNATFDHLRFAAANSPAPSTGKMRRHEGEHHDDDEVEIAAKGKKETLFWTFASSTNTGLIPPKTPQLQALGEGDVKGVNQHLLKFLPTLKGKRLGILMFDFFEEPANLVPEFLALLSPEQAKALGD